MGYLQCSYPRTLFRIASSRRYAQIPARKHILAHICAIKQSRTKSFSTNIGTILKNMLTNFELKQLKPKLDIVKKPENRVHELTDSNVSPCSVHARPSRRGLCVVSGPASRVNGAPGQWSAGSKF